MASDLASKTCVPCRGGVPPLSMDVASRLMEQLDGWQFEQGHLAKSYYFPDFASALEFVNKIGTISEQQGHHPDIYMTWGKVSLEIWTHKIDGLTESDFILAAKFDEIPVPRQDRPASRAGEDDGEDGDDAAGEDFDAAGGDDFESEEDFDDSE
ncbi:MAG TPA: 4a-hydroxytetrahydrobiopterin dehydratase [Polyangiaceae bacterium]|nr:4a-hydroxytetrahydrobiopterin dehydratase [Polyangiaceae bacterium]